MSVPSLLDTDLYKLTMQACVHKHFRDAQVEYLLNNRSSGMYLTDEAIEWIKERINGWSELKLSESELQFLKKEVPYLPEEYYEFLADFRPDPRKEVDIDYRGGSDLTIKVHGAWHRTIWYEVPILATVSEAYFRFVDTDWDSRGQYDLAKEKTRKLIEANCCFSEFGSRRRRSYDVQKIVIQAISENFGSSSMFLGTSNVHFAHTFNLKPSGTVAHELMMGIAAYTGDYPSANNQAMEAWIDTVGPSNAGVALTDTFGTDLFLRDFKEPFISYYGGVRQDSGDPEEYTKIISEFYDKVGVPRGTKKIIYSDSLNIERCLRLRDVALKYHLVPGFGIGTFFTNDFYLASDPTKKSKPLNIVMKISMVNNRPAVKLSDNSGKNTGDPQEVARIKEVLGYTEQCVSINESERWN